MCSPSTSTHAGAADTPPSPMTTRAPVSSGIRSGAVAPQRDAELHEPDNVRGTRRRIEVRAGRSSTTTIGISAVRRPARSTRRISSVSKRSFPNRHCRGDRLDRGTIHRLHPVRVRDVQTEERRAGACVNAAVASLRSAGRSSCAPSLRFDPTTIAGPSGAVICSTAGRGTRGRSSRCRSSRRRRPAPRASRRGARRRSRAPRGAACAPRRTRRRAGERWRRCRRWSRSRTTIELERSAAARAGCRRRRRPRSRGSRPR